MGRFLLKKKVYLQPNHFTQTTKIMATQRKLLVSRRFLALINGTSVNRLRKRNYLNKNINITNGSAHCFNQYCNKRSFCQSQLKLDQSKCHGSQSQVFEQHKRAKSNKKNYYPGETTFELQSGWRGIIQILTPIVVIFSGIGIIASGAILNPDDDDDNDKQSEKENKEEKIHENVHEKARKPSIDSAVTTQKTIDNVKEHALQ